MPDALSQARAALPGCWLSGLTEFKGGVPVNATGQCGATLHCGGGDEYHGSGDTLEEAIRDAVEKGKGERGALIEHAVDR
jgi:hypothetical protein